jgi:small subunit ribosomal protein S16
MPVKIRLQRHGRKRYAYYHIVVADSRAPRDGRFIERLGSFNPNTNPATIQLDFEKSLQWLFNGAQPTDTTRQILSNEGVMMKKHLIEGAKKGAFDQSEVEVRFSKWLNEKEAKIAAKKEKLAGAKSSAANERLELEKKVNAEKAQAIAKKKADAEAAAKAANAPAAAEEVAENTEEAAE